MSGRANPSEHARTHTVPPSGFAMARTRDGHHLPVIDVTDPRFAIPDDPATVRALYDTFVEGERRRHRIPKFIMQMMMRAAARNSRMVRALFTSDASFLDGVTTYLLKLDADHLVPPYDSPMDRRMAASPHVRLIRLRMQQVARFLADGLVEDLAAAAGAPLHLINIGGGTALDSLNALILLRRDRPDLMRRPVVIHVLDSSADAPFFGANALAALQADGRPLHGLDAAWQRHDYDWNAPAALARLVRDLVGAGGVVAASSEGALFDYGSDDAIVGNLAALRADGAGARMVAGSVTPDDEMRRWMLAETRFRLIPRGLDGFAPVAARTQFSIARAERAGLSDLVLLRPC